MFFSERILGLRLSWRAPPEIAGDEPVRSVARTEYETGSPNISPACGDAPWFFWRS